LLAKVQLEKVYVQKFMNFYFESIFELRFVLQLFASIFVVAILSVLEVSLIFAGYFPTLMQIFNFSSPNPLYYSKQQLIRLA
jgi:type III secretory pathway component EscU